MSNIIHYIETEGELENTTDELRKFLNRENINGLKLTIELLEEKEMIPEDSEEETIEEQARKWRNSRDYVNGLCSDILINGAFTNRNNLYKDLLERAKIEDESVSQKVILGYLKKWSKVDASQDELVKVSYKILNALKPLKSFPPDYDPED